MRAARRRLLVPFLAPALLFYTVFFIGPAISTFVLSFSSWTGPGSEFKLIGLANYAAMIEDPVFQRSLWNTLTLLVGVGAVVFALSFMYSSALENFRGRQIVQAILFLPNVVPPVALGLMWIFALDPTIGLVNTILRSVGASSLAQPWLGAELVFPSVMAGLVWIYTGFFTLLLLAGIDKIPRDYHDLTRVEGANALQKFFYVTLPMIWDVFAIAVILWVIAAIKLFDFIVVLTGAQGETPPTSVWTLAVHMYLVSLGGRTPVYRLGYGSAIAVSMVLLVLVLAILARRFLSRERVEF
jgi:raffinose/stachyose/melibiose transport system permease protein